MPKSLRFVILALPIILGCSNNPTGPDQGIQVTVPNKREVWKSWLDSFLMEWVPTESDSVKIELFNGTMRVGSLSGWTENDGSYIRTEHIMCCEESGTDYRIRITDNLGKTGQSESFTIENELDIISPEDGDIWYRCGGQYMVEWTPSCAMFVYINLMKNDTHVVSLASIPQTNGCFVFQDSLPDSLGTGSDYSIQVVDSNMFIGYSGLFSIEDSSPGPHDIHFAVISPGSFTMGAISSEVGSTGHERPVHSVSLDYTFQVSMTEVTQDQWMTVMGYNHSHFPGGNRPVENVSWTDCQAFLDSLNIHDQTWAYRLPSEAEWEYVCRSTSTTRFYWGIDMNDDYCWFYGNSEGESHPVGQKLSNLWGLVDMTGNVLEWCEDNWHETYDGAPVDGSAWVSGSSTERVIRGGCWDYGDALCRSAFRYCFHENWGNHYIGFRIVRVQR